METKEDRMMDVFGKPGKQAQETEMQAYGTEKLVRGKGRQGHGDWDTEKFGKAFALVMTCLMILPLMLCLTPVLPVHAVGSASFSLRTSASQVRIGDSVTITGVVNTSEPIATFDLSVLYNAGQLQYVRAEGITPSIRSGELDVNAGSGKVQLLYLDAEGGSSCILNPVGGSASVFRVIFKVVGGNPGDRIDLGLQIRTIGNSFANAMSASGSGTQMTLAAPLSGNADLATLAIDPGPLQPDFSTNRTSYSLSVPFSVDRIKVAATPVDPAARVSIDSPILAAGGTSAVTVTVTAASGARKTYTISVSRARDPNYVPSANNNLASLSIAGFNLSPAFDKSRKEYIVYLPNEVDHVAVAAKPEDARASTAVIGGSGLVAGQANEIQVTCTAENGSVQKYSIFALRAEPFTGRAMLGNLLSGTTPGVGGVGAVAPGVTPGVTPGATTGATAGASQGTIPEPMATTAVTAPTAAATPTAGGTDARATELTATRTGADAQGGAGSSQIGTSGSPGGASPFVWILLTVFAIAAVGEGIYIWRGKRHT